MSTARAILLAAVLVCAVGPASAQAPPRTAVDSLRLEVKALWAALAAQSRTLYQLQHQAPAAEAPYFRPSLSLSDVAQGLSVTCHTSVDLNRTSLDGSLDPLARTTCFLTAMQ